MVDNEKEIMTSIFELIVWVSLFVYVIIRLIQ